MYIVIELQTNRDGQVSNIVTSYDTLPQAENKFYTICAFAAISDIYIHSAVILDATGMNVAQRSFTHPIIIEPESEVSE